MTEASDWQTWFLQKGLQVNVILQISLWLKILQIVVYAANDPWNFLLIVLTILAPFFMISAYCAWKLVQDINHKEKDKKRKAKRDANISKARRHANKKNDW